MLLKILLVKLMVVKILVVGLMILMTFAYKFLKPKKSLYGPHLKKWLREETCFWEIFARSIDLCIKSSHCEKNWAQWYTGAYFINVWIFLNFYGLQKYWCFMADKVEPFIKIKDCSKYFRTIPKFRIFFS